MTWKQTSCCLCLQTCGLEVMVENNRIVKVRPDKANLRSQGYACRKGLKIAHFQHHRQRLEQPLKRQNDHLVALSWDEALGEIGQRLGEILDRHGPRSIAVIGGGSGGCQISGRFSGRFLRIRCSRLPKGTAVFSARRWDSMSSLPLKPRSSCPLF